MCRIGSLLADLGILLTDFITYFGTGFLHFLHGSTCIVLLEITDCLICHIFCTGLIKSNTCRICHIFGILQNLTGFFVGFLENPVLLGIETLLLLCQFIF